MCEWSDLNVEHHLLSGDPLGAAVALPEGLGRREISEEESTGDGLVWGMTLEVALGGGVHSCPTGGAGCTPVRAVSWLMTWKKG